MAIRLAREHSSSNGLFQTKSHRSPIVEKNALGVSNSDVTLAGPLDASDMARLEANRFCGRDERKATRSSRG
jgi:hypothetical protein